MELATAVMVFVHERCLDLAHTFGLLYDFSISSASVGYWNTLSGTCAPNGEIIKELSSVLVAQGNSLLAKALVDPGLSFSNNNQELWSTSWRVGRDKIIRTPGLK